jgi:hypothetical protein
MKCVTAAGSRDWDGPMISRNSVTCILAGRAKNTGGHLTLIEQFTYEQAQEMLSLVSEPIEGNIIEAILRALDEERGLWSGLWSSPEDLIRWMYNAREAWK